jgi:hypothetical protein
MISSKAGDMVALSYLWRIPPARRKILAGGCGLDIKN